MSNLTQEHLRELLDYCPETGIFLWKKPRPNASAGSIAGGLTPFGYTRISIEGRPYQSHRLAWFYVTGAWPSQEIDHINGVRNDNRFVNLREATPSQNQANKTMRSDNTSGVKGVTWDRCRNKWKASINVNRQMINIGRFADLEAAAMAYENAAKEHFGQFARPERAQ